VVPIDSNISLHKLEVFLLVVELGGVTRAAEHLFVAQPVVTAHIRSLEKRLGMTLFYREGRTLQLTEAGHAVLDWADELVRRTRQMSRHLDELAEGSQGSVVLSSSMSIGSYELPAVLSRFRRRFPAVSLRLLISDSEHAIADAVSGEVDFAVVAAQTNPTIPGAIAEPIGTHEFALVAAPDSDIPDRPLTSLELRDLWFIEPPQESIRRRFADAALRNIGITDRKVAIEMAHPEAMKRAAMAGLGVAVLFRSSVAEELAAGTLRELDLGGVPLNGPVYMVRRADKVFSAAQQELTAEISAHFGKHP
jgi:DNA-binding transcriptional LysR family regulator